MTDSLWSGYWQKNNTLKTIQLFVQAQDNTYSCNSCLGASPLMVDTTLLDIKTVTVYFDETAD